MLSFKEISKEITNLGRTRKYNPKEFMTAISLLHMACIVRLVNINNYEVEIDLYLKSFKEDLEENFKKFEVKKNENP